MGEALDKLKALLAECTPEELFMLLEYIRLQTPKHPLEERWGIEADVILSAIARSTDLTQRGVRGIIAEAVFEKVLIPLTETGWKAEQIIDDRPYDFLIQKVGEVKIQVKLQRKQQGVPLVRRFAGTEMYVVEVQKTRTGKDSTTNEATRPYRFGEFDIIAVNMQPSTGDWKRFFYTVGNWLLPRAEDEKLIQVMQPVPKEPNHAWTDDLETCIEWFRSGKKQKIL